MKSSPFLCLFAVIQLEMYNMAGKYNKVRMIQILHETLLRGKFIANTVGCLSYIALSLFHSLSPFIHAWKYAFQAIPSAAAR